VGKRDSWVDNVYLNSNLGVLTILEGFLCACFVFAVVKGFEMNETSMVIFHSMLALGYGSVFFLSVKPWANA
jgi:hypothetical protein